MISLNTTRPNAGAGASRGAVFVIFFRSVSDFGVGCCPSAEDTSASAQTQSRVRREPKKRCIREMEERTETHDAVWRGVPVPWGDETFGQKKKESVFPSRGAYEAWTASLKDSSQADFQRYSLTHAPVTYAP